MSVPQPTSLNDRLLIRLASIPRLIPVLVVLACLVLGALVPGVGWIFTALVVAFLAWLLLLSWPRLTPVERLMRVAVLFFVAAIAVIQARPRG